MAKANGMARPERRSAGLLLYRRSRPEGLEVFLVHPGGPFFARKDKGAWGVPKGQAESGETPLEAAQREFTEETGFVAAGPFRELGTIRQAGGKLVTAWACEGDCDPAKLRSITCEVVWPPRSGKTIVVPEIDRGEWFGVGAARERMKDTQFPLVERLVQLLKDEG